MRNNHSTLRKLYNCGFNHMHHYSKTLHLIYITKLPTSLHLLYWSSILIKLPTTSLMDGLDWNATWVQDIASSSKSNAFACSSSGQYMISSSRQFITMQWYAPNALYTSLFSVNLVLYPCSGSKWKQVNLRKCDATMWIWKKESYLEQCSRGCQQQRTPLNLHPHHLQSSPLPKSVILGTQSASISMLLDLTSLCTIIGTQSWCR